MGFLSYDAPKSRRPFGFIMDNGLNFAKSIHDPKSVLRRFLFVVETSNYPLTKFEILKYAGYDTNVVRSRVTYRDYDYVNGKFVGIGYPSRKTYVDKQTRGYMSWYFSGMHKAGFLVPVRQKGNRVVWVKGPNFPEVSKIINVKV